MQHTVLLVDDDPNVLAGLSRSLRKEPYRLRTASNAEDAWLALSREPVDLIVADQEMPGLSGVELLSRVRKAHPSVVRFVLTGRATLGVALKAINDGSVSRFFTKPCNEVDLKAAVREALQQKDLMEQSWRLLKKTKQQSALIDQLEEQNPGITRVERDTSGAIVLEDPPDIDTFLDEIRREVGEA